MSDFKMPTERAHADILPSSVCCNPKALVFRGNVPWLPIFCANCGTDGGWIPEEAKDQDCFYLCNPCAEKWSPLVGTYVVPDNVFWERVKQTQLELYGRELSGEEIAEALKDEHHILTKLARDRQSFKGG